VAIKAAFGGGGRELKVARTLDEIPKLLAPFFQQASLDVVDLGFGARSSCDL